MAVEDQGGGWSFCSCSTEGNLREGNLKTSDLVDFLWSKNLVLRFQKRITLQSSPFGVVIIGVALMRL